MPSCMCTVKAHDHTGTCKGDGFSLSAEHGNEWLCKDCYEQWLEAKQSVLSFQGALMTIAVNSPDKLKQAQETISKILGGKQ